MSTRTFCWLIVAFCAAVLIAITASLIFDAGSPAPVTLRTEADT